MGLQARLIQLDVLRLALCTLEIIVLIARIRSGISMNEVDSEYIQ